MPSDGGRRAAAGLKRSSPQSGHVVVTGAAGFLGSHLIRALAGGGNAVNAVDRRPPPAGAALAGVAWNRADAGELAGTGILDGAKAVFHLAGATGVRASWGDRFAAYLADNVLATQRLLEACRAAGVPRLVLASSSSVYGSCSSRPSSETDVLAPVSPYGVSKLAAERLGEAYARSPGSPLSVVALRYFTVYGPDQRPDMLFARLFTAVCTGRALEVFGDGGQRRSFTYVDDAVAATLPAAELAVNRFEAFNVAGISSIRVVDAVELASRACGRVIPTRFGPPQAGDVEVTDADLTIARERLGYVPATALECGLRQQWLASQRDLRPDRVAVVNGGSRA